MRISDWSSDVCSSDLDLHVVPLLGRKRVGDIETAQILAALGPIWTAKPQIARKVRHRVLQVLAFAKSHGWRTAPLPELADLRSEEHTSELQSLMRISYAVFCLKKTNNHDIHI